jgi:hypothetical protein
MARIPDIDNNRNDQIYFLLWRKFGKALAANLGSEEVDRYSRELDALSPEELRKRLDAAYLIIREEREAEESNRWFNKPDAAADISHWSACPYWTIDEGVALLLGKDPRRVNWEAVKSSTYVSSVAKRFAEIRDLATRAQVAKVIGAANVPGVFLRWAERTGIDVPPDLREAVTARGILIADWQDAYDKTKARADQTDAQLSAARSEISRLTADRDALLRKLEERPAGTWPWGERETELLKHLAAAADRFWKHYDPSDQTTAPRSADVQEWLQKRSVPKRVAQVMAQILREDGLPVGPRR